MDKERKIIEFELYKGRVKGKLYEDNHAYWMSIDGGKMTRKSGITTILGIKDKSKALGGWYQQLTADYLLKLLKSKVKLDEEKALECAIQNELQTKGAADIGKLAHSWIEVYIKNKMGVKGMEIPPMPEVKEAIQGVNGFLEWEGGLKKVKYHGSELLVYSMKHDIMGCMDLDFSVNGMRCVGDFKTSNGLYNTVRVQTLFYKNAKEEELGEEIYKGRWAIRLSKHSEEEYYAKEERKKELKKYLNKALGREYKDYPTEVYQAFEAKFLDEDEGDLGVDELGLKHFIGLNKWDKKTDFWQLENNK